MSSVYLTNFVIEDSSFTRNACSKIVHSMFDSHNEEFKTRKFEYGVHWTQNDLDNPKPLLEKMADELYSSGGLSYLPYPNNPCGMGIDRNRSAEKDKSKSDYYQNVPISKSVFVISTEAHNILWYDDSDDTKERKRIAKNLANLVKDSITVYNAIHPIAGSNCWDNDPSTVTLNPTSAEHITWLTFFGPELVKKFGREKLLSAPAYKIEQFSDGGILLMSGPTPFGNKKSEYFEEWSSIECQDKIAKHLGLGEYLSKTRGKINE